MEDWTETGRCNGCKKYFVWRAKKKQHVVVANVYKRPRGAKPRWDRVELWHPDCYEDAGSPHGDLLSVPLAHSGHETFVRKH